MRPRLLALTAIALALPGLALAAPAVTAKLQLKATLSGMAEAPQMGSMAGKGNATITIAGSAVCWKFANVAGIGKPLAAHVHKAPMGKAGPVVVPLGAQFKTAGCTSSSAGKAIAATPKAFYVNVHTAKYKGGAIRGQLRR